MLHFNNSNANLLSLLPINFPGLMNNEPKNPNDNHKNIHPYSNKSPSHTIQYSDNDSVKDVIDKCVNNFIRLRSPVVRTTNNTLSVTTNSNGKLYHQQNNLEKTNIINFHSNKLSNSFSNLEKSQDKNRDKATKVKNLNVVRDKEIRQQQEKRQHGHEKGQQNISLFSEQKNENNNLTRLSRYNWIYALRLISNNSASTIIDKDAAAETPPTHSFFNPAQKMSIIQSNYKNQKNSYYQLTIRAHLTNLIKFRAQDPDSFDYYYIQSFKNYLLSSKPNLLQACVIAKLELYNYKVYKFRRKYEQGKLDVEFTSQTNNQEDDEASFTSSDSDTEFNNVQISSEKFKNLYTIKDHKTLTNNKVAILNYVNNSGSRSNFKDIEDTIGWQNLLPYSILTEYSENTKAIRTVLKNNVLELNIDTFDGKIQLLEYLKNFNLINFCENYTCRIGLETSWASKIQHKIKVSLFDTISHVNDKCVDTKFLGSFKNILSIRQLGQEEDNRRIEEDFKLRIDIDGSQEPLILSLDTETDLENLKLLIDMYAKYMLNRGGKSLIINHEESILGNNSDYPIARPRAITSNQYKNFSKQTSNLSYESIHFERQQNEISTSIPLGLPPAISTDALESIETENDDYDVLDNSLSIFSVGNKVQLKELDKTAINLKSICGNGQFGEVFMATYNDPYSGNVIYVAVKQCKPSRVSVITSPQDTANKLLEEALVMQQFDHPNILRLIGVCKDSPVYIVMELCHYGDLRNYLTILRNKNSQIKAQIIDLKVAAAEESSKTGIKMPEDHVLLKNANPPIPKPTIINIKQKLEWSLQLASALAYLANLSYVHRDVAARNLLLSKDMQIKLSDFGLSREVLSNENHEYTSAQPSRWPIKWMAPESISFYKFSSKSDIWGFAVTVWEILSEGIKPYGMVSNGEILSLLKKGQRLEMPKNCPPSLYNLLLSCWEYKASKRANFSQIKLGLSRVIEKNDQIVKFDTVRKMNKERSEMEQGLRSNSGSISQLSTGVSRPGSRTSNTTNSYSNFKTSAVELGQLPPDLATSTPKAIQKKPTMPSTQYSRLSNGNLSNPLILEKNLENLEISCGQNIPEKYMSKAAKKYKISPTVIKSHSESQSQIDNDYPLRLSGKEKESFTKCFVNNINNTPVSTPTSDGKTKITKKQNDNQKSGDSSVKIDEFIVNSDGQEREQDLNLIKIKEHFSHSTTSANSTESSENNVKTTKQKPTHVNNNIFTESSNFNYNYPEITQMCLPLPPPKPRDEKRESRKRNKNKTNEKIATTSHHQKQTSSSESSDKENRFRSSPGKYETNIIVKKEQTTYLDQDLSARQAVLVTDQDRFNNTFSNDSKYDSRSRSPTPSQSRETSYEQYDLRGLVGLKRHGILSASNLRDMTITDDFPSLADSIKNAYYSNARKAIKQIILISEAIKSDHDNKNFNGIAVQILELAKIINLLIQCLNFDFKSQEVCAQHSPNSSNSGNTDFSNTSSIDRKIQKFTLIKKSFYRDLSNVQKHLKNLQLFYNTDQCKHYKKVLMSCLIPMAKNIEICEVKIGAKEPIQQSHDKHQLDLGSVNLIKGL